MFALENKGVTRLRKELAKGDNERLIDRKG